MTTDAASPMIILKSNDGASFELTKRAACMADFVKDSLGDNEDDDDGDDDNDNNKVVVDVLRVNGECLAKVVDFLKHHDEEAMPEIPTPLGGNTFREVMTVAWYQEFVDDDNMTQNMLFALLTAANYMGIKPLLDLACLKVTFQLNGKNSEEIRKILSLPELTPEEEARAREEHRWIFEDSY